MQRRRLSFFSSNHNSNVMIYNKRVKVLYWFLFKIIFPLILRNILICILAENLPEDVRVLLALRKPIIKRPEEVIKKKKRIGLQYENKVSFYILDYFKSIQFLCVGYLQDNSCSLAPLPQEL